MIKLSQVDKYYRKGKPNAVHALDSIDIELPSTGMIAIFGRSGCGKTTLLNAIGGLDHPDSGTVTVMGEDMFWDPDTVRNKHIGYVFQNYCLLTGETVFENVAVSLRLCGVSDSDEIEKRVLQSLSAVGMERYRDRMPNALSGGQQQRVAIARALVRSPDIILADEPTGNLDDRNTLGVMDILKSLSASRAVILVTHEAELVDKYCDRVIEMKDGKVISVYDNQSPAAMSDRKNTAVYLGDLPKSNFSLGNVNISYYGEPQGDIDIRIVSANGKLYLKCETENVIISGGEDELREGKREEEPAEPREPLVLPDPEPVAGKNFGRLYSFGGAFIGLWKKLLREPATKADRKLKRSFVSLFLCLSLMTTSLGVACGFFASYIGMVISALLSVVEDCYYLPVDANTDISHLYGAQAEGNGILNAYLSPTSIYSLTEYITLTNGALVSAATNYNRIETHIEEYRSSELHELVAGSRELSNNTDVIITTGIADALMESELGRSLNGYEDLIGMSILNLSLPKSIGVSRIVGIVRSPREAIFRSPLLYSFFVYDGLALAVYPDALINCATSPESGTVTVLHTGEDAEIKEGETMTLFGNQLTVGAVRRIYTSESQIYDYFYYERGYTLMNFDAYYATLTENKNDYDVTKARAEWLYEYYGPKLAEFVNEYLLRYSYNGIRRFTWLYAVKGEKSAIFEEAGDYTVQKKMLHSLEYYNTYGYYPTEAQLTEFNSTTAVDTVEYTLSSLYQNEYLEYYYGINFYTSNNRILVISDEDYASLSRSVGALSSEFTRYSVGSDSFYVSEGGWHYLNMKIYTDGSAKAEKYLEERYGEDLLSPFEGLYSVYREAYHFLSLFVNAILIIIAIFTVSTFFTTRLTYAARIKEISALRAIGASSGNLTLRYFAELLALMLPGSIPGWMILTSILIDANVTPSAALYTYALAALIVLISFLLNLLVAIVPLAAALHKPPARLLSAYDV